MRRKKAFRLLSAFLIAAGSLIMIACAKTGEAVVSPEQVTADTVTVTSEPFVSVAPVCSTAVPEKTPEATALPTPEPTPEPVEEVEAVQSPEPVPSGKLVALTFDDGPDKWMTGNVLDVLERYNVPATFFLLGEKINEETAPLIERAVGLNCEIGFHGWCHSNMTQMSPEYNQKCIRRFLEALETYVNVPVPVTLARAPGGNSDAVARMGVGGMGYAMILWDVDSADWLNQDKDIINETVLKRVKDGSIVLMHDRHKPTPEALETLIPALQEQGYTLVTVSDLIKRDGGVMEAGKEYRCVPPAEEVVE